MPPDVLAVADTIEGVIAEANSPPPATRAAGVADPLNHLAQCIGTSQRIKQQLPYPLELLAQRISNRVLDDAPGAQHAVLCGEQFGRGNQLWGLPPKCLRRSF
jgi:hypothetical protein